MEQKEIAVRQLFRLAELMITYMWPMQTIKSRGLNRTQLSVLLELTGQDYQTLTQLANQVSVTNQSMTAISSKLVNLGYVERVYNKDNRREITLHITEQGRAFEEEVIGEEIKYVMDSVCELNEDEFVLLRESSEQLYLLLEKTDFGKKLEYKKNRDIGDVNLT